MSTVAMAAVFRHSQSRGSARLVLLAMADEANDQGLLTAYRRSHSHLGRKANVDRSTVKRAIDTLEQLGELRVLATGDGRESSSYQLVISGLAEGAQDEPPGGAARHPRGRNANPQGAQDAPPIITLLPGTPVVAQGAAEPPAPAKPPRPNQDAAREVAKAVWERKKPRPATPFPGVCQVAERLLDAGWAAEAVEDAMVSARTISIGWCEGELNKNRPPTTGPRANGHVPRDAVEGVLDL